jgi:hypothetical protein
MENIRFNEEDFISLLKNVVQHIQEDEDLVEITRLKRVFKKAVPLSRRSYVGCFLAKILLEQGGAKFLAGREKHSGARIKPQRKRFQRGEESREKSAPHHIIIDESLAAKIFISIGKNRRVFPRDIVHLLSQKANLSQDRIGEINVCDNYSFVQLFAQDAESAIAALNGCGFHGRTLTVSHARKKEEADKEEFSPAHESERTQRANHRET